MADLESSLRTLVLQQVTVNFYWNKVPDNPGEPYVRAKSVTDNPSYHQQGESVGKSLVQLDIFDTDKDDCNSLTETLRATLSGYRGAMGSYHVRILVRNVPSDWEENARLFRRILEMEIGYAS